MLFSVFMCIHVCIGLYGDARDKSGKGIGEMYTM